MQDIQFHIAYLLSQHECVIVPGLGAFVVSPIDREKANGEEILSPPENFVEFNSEIIHNDGLLANAIAKDRYCSCEEANSFIDEYVTEILDSFNRGRRVQIPHVGILYSKDNKILFQQDRTSSCNAINYGLTGFSMPYVQDLLQGITDSPPDKDKKTAGNKVKRRLIVVYTCAVVAALIIMCIIPTPLNNGHFNSTPAELTGIVQSPEQSPVNDEEKTPEETVPAPEEITTPEETVTPSVGAINQVKKELKPYYYIIVASCSNQTDAKKAVTEFNSKGFENIDILHTDNRYRIYTNRFEDKEEAEKFLNQFRIGNPKYAKAWLLRHKD